jgi:hypothetical protein
MQYDVASLLWISKSNVSDWVPCYTKMVTLRAGNKSANTIKKFFNISFTEERQF